jgi:hypothetical protein
LVIDLFQQAERDAARKRAIEYAQAKYQQAFDGTRSRAAAASVRIAGRRNWSRGEVGFEQVSFREQYQRRPRDPFVRVKNAMIREANEKPADVMRDARECVEAARLVPEGMVYDSYRATFLACAADLAATAASRDWFADSRYSYGSPLAKEAVRICRTRLAYDGDLSDWGKYELARALNFAGFHGEALATASKAQKLYRNPGFAYDYACLMSLDGQTKLALEWLEFSFKLGGSNVAWAKQDPELAKVRTQQAEGFTRLTQVKWGWTIKYGVFNDDIVLENNSPFPLTNVTLTPTIKKNGRTYARTLTVAWLGAGRSYTWHDVFSIPGSSSDSATATIECDQTK